MRVEGVGLEDVGAGIEVGRVDVVDDLRLRQRQEVVVALQIVRPAREAFAAIIFLGELVALDHGAHGTVQDQDSLLEETLKPRQALATGAVGNGIGML